MGWKQVLLIILLLVPFNLALCLSVLLVCVPVHELLLLVLILLDRSFLTRLTPECDIRMDLT